jgi:hypothetical protein
MRKIVVENIPLISRCCPAFHSNEAQIALILKACFWDFIHKHNNMKKIYSLLILIIAFAACKTMPISMNPDKGSFNSGTIGSVKETDNIPVANAGTKNVNFKDTSHAKTDTVRNFLSH